MKKLTCLVLVLFFAVGVSVFCAWSPIANAAVVSAEQEVRYADSPIYSTYASETITYTSKEYVDEVQTVNGTPQYFGVTNMTNACGAVAGAEIVGFYDKYYPELIPDWVSYYTSSGKYRGVDATYVPALLYEMYDLMQTNVAGEGVSESEFITGLTQYFVNHGRTITLTNAKSGNKMDLATCRTAFSQNKPVVMFITPGDVYMIGGSYTNDVIAPLTISGNHIMLAYGCVTINYYNASGLFRSDTYIKVTTGYSSSADMLYKIETANVNAAYVTNVA